MVLFCGDVCGLFFNTVCGLLLQSYLGSISQHHSLDAWARGAALGGTLFAHSYGVLEVVFSLVPWQGAHRALRHLVKTCELSVDSNSRKQFVAWLSEYTGFFRKCFFGRARPDTCENRKTRKKLSSVRSVIPGSSRVCGMWELRMTSAERRRGGAGGKSGSS